MVTDACAAGTAPAEKLPWMLIPAFTTGGALMTMAGGVPSGADTMTPGRDPGGGGTKIPEGPMGRGPATTPGRGSTLTMRAAGGGGTNTRPEARQWPGMNTTQPSRFS